MTTKNYDDSGLVDALKQAEKEMRCPPQEEKEAA